MAWINLIPDLAALALWLDWLQLRSDPLARTGPASLADTLRRAEVAGPTRWKFPVILAALLLARAWLYLQLSAVVNLTPKLRLGFINIPFRGDLPLHMVVFSLLSFAFVLGAFYLSMLLLSAINGGAAGANPVHELVRLQVKWLERWPKSLKLLCPFLLGGLAWLTLHPLLHWLAVVPGAKSVLQLCTQAAVIGAGTYLAWKYLLLGVLLCHLVNAQVYLGNAPVWNYLDVTARNLLSPLRRLPLRAGRVDFLPLLVMAMVVLLAHLIENPPERFYRLLPF
jgi:uncharacterized protein YggT (Ycf19 family)